MDNRLFDVTALGELLIDFTETGISNQGNTLFEANPGGAPCNLLSMVSRLGYKTAFIGKVGNDSFGHQLRASLNEVGIDSSFLMSDDSVHTTLAFVSKKEDGDRDFAFYRKPGADINLKPEEISEDLIANSKIFHFGTLSMTDEPARSATLKAIEYAEKHHCLRSFDPNLREPLWDSLEDAHSAVDWGLKHCDVLKISDNEIQWFTGKDDYEEGIALLRELYNIPVICLSMGKSGSRAYFGNERIEVPAFLQDETLDTTGAGDTFGGCILSGILSYGINGLNRESMLAILTFANAAASLVTTRKGALRVMPTKEEVEALLRERMI